jgi:hypothetical protein
MTMKHNDFTAWVKDGQSQPMNDDLLSHLENCDKCQTEYNELVEIQGLFPLPDSLLNTNQIAGIRFRLQTECNIQKSEPSEESFSLSLWKKWFLPVAGFAMISGLIIFSSIWVFSNSASDSTKNISKSTIVAENGAKWSYLSRGKVEVVSVESGSVNFSVKPLSYGESFNVVAGNDWVEVRGTMFRVTVNGKKLKEVSVTKGAVAVHVQGVNRLILAGQIWKRELPQIEKIPDSKDLLAKKDLDIPKSTVIKSAKKLPLPTETSIVGDNQNSKSDKLSKIQPHKDVKKPQRIEKKTVILKKIDKTKIVVIENKNGLSKPKKNPQSEKYVAAYRVLQSGNWRKAVVLFSSLLHERGLGSNRSNVVFWLSQAHLQGGQYSMALSRLKQFIRNYPNSWRAKDVKKQIKQLSSRK